MVLFPSSSDTWFRFPPVSTLLHANRAARVDDVNIATARSKCDKQAQRECSESDFHSRNEFKERKEEKKRKSNKQKKKNSKKNQKIKKILTIIPTKIRGTRATATLPLLTSVDGTFVFVVWMHSSWVSYSSRAWTISCTQDSFGKCSESGRLISFSVYVLWHGSTELNIVISSDKEPQKAKVADNANIYFWNYFWQC